MTSTKDIQDDLSIRFFLIKNQNTLISKIKDSESNIEKKPVKKDRTDYNGVQGIFQFWADLLKEDFYFRDITQFKEIEMNEELTFTDVLLTDWIPRIPGLFYHKIMWEKSENLEESKERRILKQFNYADVRLGIIEGKIGDYKIFNLVKNEEFIAHGDISKGIPILIPLECFQNASLNDTFDTIEKVLNKKGAIKIKKIKCIVRNIYNLNIELIIKMDKNRPIINKKKAFLKGAILIAQKINSIEIWEDLPDCPVLGNAWTYYLSDDKESKFLYYYFWVGTEDYNDSINNACNIIMKRIPKNKYALFEIDAEDNRFESRHLKGVTYGPKEIYLEDITSFQVYIRKNIAFFLIICAAIIISEIFLVIYTDPYIAITSASIISMVTWIVGNTIHLSFKKQVDQEIEY